ncbi:MAG TPA: bifunctional isocitrate dehydrogenase kinase/phosphatase [Gemmatimonadales bacterium]|jgi:isocitrate dehydrogenase kinase/phosphatase|nr:bifunctional isocitrate dehydrogenase kinase/phosphatase [Gemmatimonadales bacterium]
MIGNGPEKAATIVVGVYQAYADEFAGVTRRARRRFETRDWHGTQTDAAARLALYRRHLDECEHVLGACLGPSAADRALWARARSVFAGLMEGRDDAELAETFYNSATRRVLGTVGADPEIECLEFPASGPLDRAAPVVYDSWHADGSSRDALRAALAACGWAAPYADLDGDAVRGAALVDARLRELGWAGGPLSLEVLRAPFYRNKGAYLVGRILGADEVVPLVLPLLHGPDGIVLDAVLLTIDEASIVFGFSWSYFFVDAPHPRGVVSFLRSIMPHKPVDELYTSIGHNKHGKTELYRSLMRHLERPEARFAFAEGDEGMVMGVFTLPSFNVVFKIIKDVFGAPKQTTRRSVMAKYHLVFQHDRVGRLADAQEFERLEFRRRCFPDDLLAYLLRVAGQNVAVDGDRVVVRHCYTERRVTPLNLFLAHADPAAARDAILDYGNAIKDLAGADIFTGDMLLKNFGVTRNGRVICYDYDELCLLRDCHFRRIPLPRSYEDELSAEPWFHVGEQDVFPEEFAAFLVPAGPLRDGFLAAHGDLLTVGFWQRTQERLRAGEIFDFYPYRQSRRLARGG